MDGSVPIEVVLAITAYVLVKDIVAPLIKRMLGSSPNTDEKTSTSVAVLEATVNHIQDDISEIKSDIKYLRGKV